LVAVERKSSDDLVGFLKNGRRERFERELSGEQGLDCFALVVEPLIAKYTVSLRNCSRRWRERR